MAFYSYYDPTYGTLQVDDSTGVAYDQNGQAVAQLDVSQQTRRRRRRKVTVISDKALKAITHLISIGAGMARRSGRESKR